MVASVWENSDYWKEETEGVGGGSFSFANGHVLNWGMFGVTPAIPLYERAGELAERHGEARRDWMFNMRNLKIFPNLQMAENASSQLRVIRPIAPGLTEMRTWCIAPKGESAAARRHRIRQYEDFFNPTGMATPDDTVSYENCQIGFADRIDLYPKRSVLADSQRCDETLYTPTTAHGPRVWQGAGSMRAPISRSEAEDLLYREALLIDSARYDEWLALFTPDVEFWMPAWRDETSTTQDPDCELSLIYYKGGRNLEDRVMRLTSDLSTASTASAPPPRVAHQVSNVLLTHADTENADVVAAFPCHRFDVQMNRTDCFFGRYEYRLVRQEVGWAIARKKIILLNDTIPTVVDITSI
ncbi:aromatic-ring-hydroxylating dioxygenase subunit beta [Novosphingobium sp.]|uniref:aromatic-ring-hydroxylating dioxygenase subunit beta n=1 Tax=Novosphingobium sp. TaxID=1874826 RepID=UPI002621E68A|nr:aromatic-ring-hydroxylating dioxygenase subunit beta [Novosphingobium sp.]